MDNNCNPCRPCKECEPSCVNYPEQSRDFNTETYQGSFQRLLDFNIGHYVTIEIGMTTCEIRTISGYIESVGGRYVVLCDPKTNCRIAGDAWQIKTVTFHCKTL